ncbi:cell division ATP-binding protein FtsE [Pseudoalteromonas tunicata]|jgi:cell division transport system ATP-binding protein|uniref:Cell division ATP-binding protein FtsE n=1 Tax=Pseudoalteromonas tunicata D2 TaxID=87626 RepID=A4C7B1_9GAMM|nr:cell division ATP-binding protein FtsE [Pseudoalteromonas tunicata]ATC95835.1 cell division transport system ATP-binding protein [Pseudoalteromonas tunicata]AXT31380.1 cell division ATP-binding protein FtsE [Pseudoalteromonas tunicata]EAR29865.1 cell division protein (ABC transporteur superfamily, ATP_binding) [Pseudoalteromonas tunicata D2]MDP4984115.1 cell division ATP-binding protein FtsE [Pseudoalteromonas tunicata]MDP5214361.1 cell division ATP-binding protein FtsE [Pseudoalteromonas t
MIKFQQVSKTYPGGHLALEKINFHLKAGELAFLTGHSGAGKSTLLKLISVMERPSAGDVFINSVKLNKLDTKQVPYIRRDIGMIFQNHRLLNRYNIFDNVAFPLVIEGMHRKDIEKRVHAALDKVGLLSKVKCFPDTLSGGEQQRVGIARAIVNSPPILLADEPTGNLDPELSVEILNLFEDFNQQGTTVLIATHDLGLIARMKYRSLTLKRGRLIDDPLTGSQP